MFEISVEILIVVTEVTPPRIVVGVTATTYHLQFSLHTQTFIIQNVNITDSILLSGT